MEQVIVTGSEGLIGSEVSKYLESKGYAVTRCDLKLGHDLTDESFVKNFFKENKAKYLVNLFALNDHVDPNRKTNSLFEISLNSFELFLKINLTSLFSVCREHARNNKQGSIINFSSTYGIVSPIPKLYPGSMKHAGYCVSKAGVIQLTKYLAVHLAPDIRVNCIVPGGVKFKQDKEFIENYSSNTPLGRMMNNGELNGVIEMLCSDKSSYMTGSVILVDGGWTVW
jgi:NAD(P)-dependent dehydrogenase (short-subunit alcohol dehydrogenase family)